MPLPTGRKSTARYAFNEVEKAIQNLNDDSNPLAGASMDQVNRVVGALAAPDAPAISQFMHRALFKPFDLYSQSAWLFVKDSDILKASRSCKESITYPAYPYGTLPSTQHVRLLKLMPKSFRPTLLQRLSFHSHLSGTICEYHLSELPTYECLSYVWGDTRGEKLFRLGNYDIPISTNLYMALRRLQSDKEPRFLWVDFLCINQANPDERAQQVQLMFEIYSRAKHVIAYLGMAARGSEHIPDFLYEVQKAIFSSKIQHSERLTEDKCIKIGLPKFNDDRWAYLTHFLARPWFCRAWIIQEALAAKKLYFMCGQWIDTAESIIHAIRIGWTHQLPLVTGWHEKQRDRRLVLTPEARSLRQLEFMTNMNICSIVTTLTDLRFKAPLLVDLLSAARLAKAGDSRDKVFALLNLCRDAGELGVLPNYKISVEEVFTRTARKIIAAGHGDLLLLAAGMPISNLELPSWMPDWSLDEPPISVELGRKICFTKPGEGLTRPEHSNIKLGNRANELIINAILVDRISLIGNSATDEQGTTSEVGTRHTAYPDLSQMSAATYQRDRLHSPEVSDDIENVFDIPESSLRSPMWPRRFRNAGLVMSYIRKSTRYSDTDIVRIAMMTLNGYRKLDTAKSSLGPLESAFRSYFGYTRYYYGSEYKEKFVTSFADRILEVLLADDKYNCLIAQGSIQPLKNKWVQLIGLHDPEELYDRMNKYTKSVLQEIRPILERRERIEVESGTSGGESDMGMIRALFGVADWLGELVDPSVRPSALSQSSVEATARNLQIETLDPRRLDLEILSRSGSLSLFIELTAEWKKYLMQQYKLSQYFQDEILAHTDGYTPLCTQAGYVGMAGPSMRLGDIVAIVQDVSVPLILRQTHLGKFQLVGPAILSEFRPGENFFTQIRREEGWKEMILV